MIPYNPWDQGTRDEGVPDYVSLAELLKEANADGFNGKVTLPISPISLLSLVSCLLSPVSCLLSPAPVSCLLSPVSCLLSPVSCLRNPVPDLSPEVWDLAEEEMSHNLSPPVSCLLSPVSRLLSPISCLLSLSPVSVSCLVSCLLPTSLLFPPLPAHGLVGDTMDGIPEAFWKASVSNGHPLGLEPEGK
jgi:hypothetical protein